MAILKSRLPLLMSLVGLMIVVGLTLFIQPGSSIISADDDSCDGHQACIKSTETLTPAGTIGHRSCNGHQACFKARGSYDIGNDSCNGKQTCKRQFEGVEDFPGDNGGIGNNSCNGTQGCKYNIASIGDNSCIGFQACRDNEGIIVGGPTIQEGSCRGYKACTGNPAGSTIESGQCNEDAGTSC